MFRKSQEPARGINAKRKTLPESVVPKTFTGYLKIEVFSSSNQSDYCKKI